MPDSERIKNLGSLCVIGLSPEDRIRKEEECGALKVLSEQAETDEERPRIYVTPRGGRYVKADELLRSKRARKVIKAMAKLDLNQTETDKSQ